MCASLASVKALESENPSPGIPEHYRDCFTPNQSRVLLTSHDPALLTAWAVASFCSLLAALESMRTEKARQEARGAFFGQPFNLR